MAVSSSVPAIDRARAHQLEQRLRQLSLGPTGQVACLVESPAPEQRQTPEAVTVIPGKGFAGDHARKSWWRGALIPGREVTAVSLEVLRVLGVAAPELIGDNLVTEGFDLRALRPGDRVQVGEVVLERGLKEHRPCAKFRDRTSPEGFAAVAQGGYRGALFVVRRGGTIRLGDAVGRMGD